MKNRSLENIQFLVTCEHASNLLPQKEKVGVKIPGSVLKTHRAWDIGASAVATHLAKLLNAKEVQGQHTRLLCDLNRTTDHKSLFSEYSCGLSHSEKQRIIKIYHAPHWAEVKTAISSSLKKGFRVIHLGVHSFTPVFDGYERPTDLGILYDPARASERAFARAWQSALQDTSAYQIHLNRPYRGNGNGLISDLRTLHSPQSYLGFEIELNQKLLRSPREQHNWALYLSRSLLEAIS